MSNFQFEPVTREDGKEASVEDLTNASTPIPVRFDYNGFKGFTAIFDRTKITVGAVQNYRRAEVKARASSSETLAQDEELRDAILAGVKFGDDAAAKAAMDSEIAHRVREFSVKAALEMAEAEPELFPLRIVMLTPAIVAWNVPGIEPSIETFQANAELAEAVIPALWASFHPTSKISEAVTEKTPNPSGADSAKISRSAKANSPKD